MENPERARLPRKRVIYYALRPSWMWPDGTDRAEPEELGVEKEEKKDIVDYWVWDHYIIPFTLYMYLRSITLAWLIDILWEVFEHSMFRVVGIVRGWDYDNPDEWPDSFRPESKDNSILIDPFTGFLGIITAWLMVNGFDIPPLRGLHPMRVDAETVIQILIICVVGMESGAGFKRLYFYGLAEMGIVTLMNLLWNDNSFSNTWPWLVTMFVTIVATSIPGFVPRNAPFPLREPLLYVTAAAGILWIVYGTLWIT